MARSSQDPPVSNTRRKTTHVEAKERILYDTSSRNSRAPTSDRGRQTLSTSYDSHTHRDEASNRKPRYSDSTIPLKNDEAETSYSRRNTHPPTTSRRPPHSDSKVNAGRTLKPQVSLSNMFEDENTGNKTGTKHDLQTQSYPSKSAQGRLRSLSDTSIYSRHGAADQDHLLQIKREHEEREDDEVSVEYVNEDEYTKVTDGNEKTLVDNNKQKEGKKDGAQVPSSDDSSNMGQNSIGLTEFAKLEKKVSVKQAEAKDKTIVEQADPIITRLTGLYEDEWTIAITDEEILYKQTAMSLGAHLDNQMLAAAYGLKKDTERIPTYRDEAQRAINSEAQAAKENLARHLLETNNCYMKLKEIEARMAKRDEKILSDIRDIREKYKSRHKKLEDEYSQKADGLEDKIEALKSEKALKGGFTDYFTKYARDQMGSSKPKSNKRGSK